MIRLAWLGHGKDGTASKEKTGSATQVWEGCRRFLCTSLSRETGCIYLQAEFCSLWVCSVGGLDTELACGSIDVLPDKWQIFTVKSFKTVFYSIPASLQKD